MSLILFVPSNKPCHSPAELCITDPHILFSFSGPVLCSELDARLADVAAGSHARQGQGFGDRCRNRGSLPTWAMLGLAHTPSMIALGCLDEGDERGEGQGLLLESTWLKARYGYHDKVEKGDETSVSTGSAGWNLNTLEQGGQDY